MHVARTRADLAAYLADHRAGGNLIAFVPTMGALHEGHLSLIALARAIAPVCVASIFVNPTQFAPHEDFARYPRQESADLALMEKAGVDVAYLPSVTDIYPSGAVSDIKAGPAAEGLESLIRPHFFDGVASVVARLFDHVRPAAAIFGEKDFQQLQVVRELVAARDYPVQIIPGPIIRDADGLALSSRNAYLSADQLKIARRLNRVLFAAAARLEADPAVNATTLAAARGELLQAGFDEVQYLEMRWGRLLAAVRIAAIRLIDNVPVAS